MNYIETKVIGVLNEPQKTEVNVMSVRYHLKDNGNPGLCRARVKDCPKESPHFVTENEAYAYLEKINTSQTFQPLTKNSKLNKLQKSNGNTCNDNDAKFTKEFRKAIPDDSELGREAIYQENILNQARTNKRPLTDQELERHQKYVDDVIKKMSHHGITTKELYGEELSPGQVVYDADREKQHQEILQDMLSRIDHIPRDHKAIISGGLSGSGKSSVLSSTENINGVEYYRIDPDDFKHELVKRGMTPKVPGMTPMEFCTMAHEESSYLSNRLSDQLRREGRNIIVDTTLTGVEFNNERVRGLQKDEYTVDGWFIDTTPENSKHRSNKRYVRGLQEYCMSGNDSNALGGRYLAPERIDQARSDLPGVNSKNAENFVALVSSGKINNIKVFDNNETKPHEINYNDFKKPIIHGRAGID